MQSRINFIIMKSFKIKAILFPFLAFLILAGGVLQSSAQTSVYTPAKGSPERKAILDGIRKYRKNSKEVYTPRDFNVRNGWAFVSADDPAEPGVDSAGFYVLLRKTGNIWKVVDEVNMTEGTNFNNEVKRLRKKFPKVPSNIFP